jgi:hypothetical protein
VILFTVGSGGALWVQRDSPDFRAHTHLWARTDLCLCRLSPLSEVKLENCMYSQSRLGWHFRMLFQSSKLKAQTSLFTETWQKRVSSFELWGFENDTPSGIGCTVSGERRSPRNVVWVTKWDYAFETSTKRHTLYTCSWHATNKRMQKFSIMNKKGVM